MFIDGVLKAYPAMQQPEAIFKIQNVADYVYSIPKEVYNWERDSFALITPFEKTWFEFRVPGESNSEGTIGASGFGGKCGVNTERVTITRDMLSVFIKAYCERGRLGSDYSDHILTEYSRAHPKYIVRFEFYFEHPSGIIRHGDFKLVLDDKGKLISVRDPHEKEKDILFMLINKDFKSLTENLSTNTHELLTMGTDGVLIMALNFLHCKNVKAEETFLGKKLLKAREKRNRIFFEKYYTLVIDPMKWVLNTDGIAQSKGLKYALHICRGHFKTYDEKGLFGKYKGVFWWPEHVKGSAEIGVVKKDYEIRPTSDE